MIDYILLGSILLMNALVLIFINRNFKRIETQKEEQDKKAEEIINTISSTIADIGIFRYENNEQHEALMNHLFHNGHENNILIRNEMAIFNTLSLLENSGNRENLSEFLEEMIKSVNSSIKRTFFLSNEDYNLKSERFVEIFFKQLKEIFVDYFSESKYFEFEDTLLKKKAIMVKKLGNTTSFNEEIIVSLVEDISIDIVKFYNLSISPLLVSSGF